MDLEEERPHFRKQVSNLKVTTSGNSDRRRTHRRRDGHSKISPLGKVFNLPVSYFKTEQKAASAASTATTTTTATTTSASAAAVLRQQQLANKLGMGRCL